MLPLAVFHGGPQDGKMMHVPTCGREYVFPVLARPVAIVGDPEGLDTGVEVEKDRYVRFRWIPWTQCGHYRYAGRGK